MNGAEIKKRREGLGLSQKTLAGKVQIRAGVSFSQQALQKLESNANASSRMMHHLLDVLDEEEGGLRYKAKLAISTIDDQHLPSLVAQLEQLSKS